jgi:pterin-4a-carbinolamine dehydratase/cephalosporin hydroxylase
VVVPGRLAASEIDAALAQLPGWRRVGDGLCARYRFATFAAAVAFTQRLAAAAEELGHHPQWTVRYRVVDVVTTTHDAGGLTALDVELAARAGSLAATGGGAAIAGDDVSRAAGAWVPPGHFYSPITAPIEVEADAARLFASGLRDLPGVDQRLPEQLALALQLSRFYADADFAEQPRPDRRYCLANEYFPYGDAFAYHALLRHLRPRRVIEVGAGWSSAVLLDTDERWLGSAIECTFVEPYPERLLSLLRPADVARTRLLRSRLQDVPLAEFAALQANDILFIDSSHVAKTGSDVLHALFAVLPALRPGVWVHVHDVHANFEYPAHWVREGRSWNEAYFVRAFLMHNRDWEIALHGATLAEYAPEQLLPRMPKLGSNVGGSLWLRKR